MAAGPNAGIYLNKLQSPTQKAKPSQPAYRPGGKGWNKEKVGLRVWGGHLHSMSVPQSPEWGHLVSTAQPAVLLTTY